MIRRVITCKCGVEYDVSDDLLLKSIKGFVYGREPTCVMCHRKVDMQTMRTVAVEEPEIEYDLAATDETRDLAAMGG